ncbi:hypothetical protein VPH35_139861 [Triticum aestivum]
MSLPPLNSSNGGFSLRLVSNHQRTHNDLASLQRAIDHVKCRITNHLLPPSTVTNITVNTIRPLMCPATDMVYAVMVGVGTGQGSKSYQLALDMATELTWMQCTSCHPCLRQYNPVFDPTQSPTFHHVSASDSGLCRAPYKRRQDHMRGFEISYSSNCVSVWGFEQLHGMVFGCAHHTEHFYTHEVLAGVLGLGMWRVTKPPTFFTKQIYHGQGVRFSYCPFPPGTIAYNFLRFGDNIPSHPLLNVHRQSTPILLPAQANDGYYVKLTGVGMFRRGPGGKGGCVIDIGTKMSVFVNKAYIHIEWAVRCYLQLHGAEPVHLQGHHLCVRKLSGHRDVLPSMTLHFDNGAGLHVMPEHVFLEIVHANIHYMCLAVFPSSELTVIGARQQINHRFIFDLHARTPSISFN